MKYRDCGATMADVTNLSVDLCDGSSSEPSFYAESAQCYDDPQIYPLDLLRQVVTICIKLLRIPIIGDGILLYW